MSLNFAHSLKTGSLLKGVIGTIPADAAAGTRNGTAINRRVNGSLAMSCTLVAMSGAETGTPDSRTLNNKIQDSADGSTDWQDYIPPDQTTVAKVPEITAASSVSEADVNLAGARQYIRAVEVLAFVAGTTPKLGVGSVIVLSGFDRTPQ